MSIISRKDAIAQNLTHYFTGSPCVHGHVAQRYVKSGACSVCVGISTTAIRSGERAVVREETRNKREAINQLIEFRVRAFECDWNLIRDTAVAMCLAKYPHLTAGDVTVKRPPTGRAAGTAMYSVMSPPGDEQAIRDTANAMLNSHKVDVQARRADILKVVCAIADSEGARPE